MKKKLLVLTAVLSAMTMLAACGKDEAKDSVSGSSVSESTISQVDPDEYVTVGEYEGIEVSYTPYTISENDVEMQIQNELNYYINTFQLYNYIPIEGRDVVETGDVANIDYVGKKDGVAFDGGTAQGYHLEIGSGSFIPGFEDGLVGVKTGETVDLDLTFPEGYTNADLAGQAVVFTVSVNGIYTKETPAFDDELMKKLSGYGLTFTTMEEYRKNVEEYLNTQNETRNETAKEDAVWDAVYATCEVSEPPTDMVEKIKQRVYDNAQGYAEQYGMELNDFIEQSMQMPIEQFDEEATAAATDSAKETLAVKAIAKKEKIEVSDEELQALKETEAANAGATVEEYFANVDEADFYDYALTQKVYEYLATVVTVKEN